ncbi:Protein of unknown function with HXXEE motif-containing protein [Oscillospiraceae bacterium]|nr:Protein of unknown function with HXXEE motif-containing protein [Oscillospiraceae bacterium]
MREYLLLLPIMFIIHDMEEIVGFGWFFRNNQWLFDRYPKVMNMYRDLKEMPWKLGVYEEFIPFFGVSLLAYYFPSNILFSIWYGFFLALTAHFFVHIGLSIKIRKYIPSVITSITEIPVSIIILYKCAKIMIFDSATVLFTIIGILLMLANFAFLIWGMTFLNRKFEFRNDMRFYIAEDE